MNNVTIDDRELQRLQRNIRLELEVSKRSEDQIINKIGNDVRVQFGRGFYARRWKEGKRGGAIRLMNQLLAKGSKGVKVRAKELMSRYAGQIPKVDKKGHVLTLLEKLVYQEFLRRAAGIGFLGGTFFGSKSRFAKKGPFTETNNSAALGIILKITKTGDTYSIESRTPGSLVVGERYDVINNALAIASAHTEEYLLRKIGPDFIKQLNYA